MRLADAALVCEVCSVPLATPKRGPLPRYCSSLHRTRAWRAEANRRPRTLQQKTWSGVCDACGVALIVPKAGPLPRYCSQPCRSADQYARHRRESWSGVCGGCGVVLNPDGGRRKFCSSRCRNYGPPRSCGSCGAMAQRPPDAINCRRCKAQAISRAKRIRLAFTIRWCKQCGCEFTPRQNQQWFCSKRCVNRLKCFNRRSWRKTGSDGEMIALADVYQRCAGRCGICGLLVDKMLRWPDPWSASIDHVIPLSRGGPHTKSNVQLAHLGCNSRKNNKVI